MGSVSEPWGWSVYVHRRTAHSSAHGTPAARSRRSKDDVSTSMAAASDTSPHSATRRSSALTGLPRASSLKADSAGPSIASQVTELTAASVQWCSSTSRAIIRANLSAYGRKASRSLLLGRLASASAVRKPSSPKAKGKPGNRCLLALGGRSPTDKERQSCPMFSGAEKRSRATRASPSRICSRKCTAPQVQPVSSSTIDSNGISSPGKKAMVSIEAQKEAPWLSMFSNTS
mmetsp:Transcript_107468/g.175811  ORF Transcript_107468/g.175811 Transcript_107468/m.175811 type:complete len:231 (-) Transcript_107468:481-1173(-)